jgi:radical SAM superfamily enzyme YgiQ (UPF0313 family)
MGNPQITFVRVNEKSGTHPFLQEANVTGIYPPLGIAYLAGAVRDAGFAPSIIDAHALDLSNDQIVKKLAPTLPAAVGITTTTFNWPTVVDLAKKIRRAFPQIKIIVGGPHLSILHMPSMTQTAFDAAIIGEGERAVVELVKRIDAGDNLAGVPGTIVREGERPVQTTAPNPIENLDTLPLPALDLLPLHRYRALTLPRPFVTMITSRGCPFKCRYCSQAYVGGVYREHGAERVLTEIRRAVTEFGAKEIVFFDETFAVNRRRLFTICETMIKEKIDVRWNIRTRGDILDEPMLRMMKKAGCHSLHIGIESGSDRIQKLMNKNLNLNDIAKTLGAAKRAGLETRGYFMIGFPGETRGEIEQTISLATRLPLDWASFTITVPHPGTDVFTEGAADGKFDGDYWENYTLGKVSEAPGYFTSDEFDEADLNMLLNKAYRRFYLRPLLLLQKACKPRLWKELPEIIRTVLKISS